MLTEIKEELASILAIEVNWPTDMQQLARMIQAITVRLMKHRKLPQSFLDLCDENGIPIWFEGTAEEYAPKLNQVRYKTATTDYGLLPTVAGPRNQKIRKKCWIEINRIITAKTAI